jgi:Ras-related protein Rab-1A
VQDTAGQERFRTITRSFYRGCHGIALVFDVTSRKSFESVSWWMQIVDQHSGESVQKMLIANKTDLDQTRVSTLNALACLRWLVRDTFIVSCRW